MSILRLSVVVFLLTVFAQGHSAEEMLSFETPEQQAFFEKLTHEFRCLKCQNQTIASSGADLAEDLRREIYTMVLAGKNRQEISEFLVARYGDFVLYRPRFTPTTLLLWVGPFLLLCVALWFAWSASRRRLHGEQVSSDTPELEKARAMLRD